MLRIAAVAIAAAATTAAIATLATNDSRKMEPTKELIDELFGKRVRKARRMSPEEKLLGGARLFHRSCRIMADGIRSQFPDADEQRVQEILRQRLAIVRRREDRL